MIPPDLQFLFPKASLLFPANLLIIILFGALYAYRKKALSAFDPRLIVRRSSTIFWSKVIALSMAWGLLVFALMQPVGNERYADEAASKVVDKLKEKGKIHKRNHELLIFVDASASMGVTDTPNGESRLTKAKDAADQIIRRLNGENVSLYAFTSSTTQLSPSTLDTFFVRLMLRQLRINEGDVGGTDFMPMMETLQTEVRRAPAASLKTAVIFSDGGDFRLDTLHGDELKNAIESMTVPLSDAASLRLRVYTVGMGSQAGGIIPEVNHKGKQVSSSLNDAILKKLAYKGRGDYFVADSLSSIDLANRVIALMKQDPATISESELITSLAGSNSNKIYDRYYQFPLGLALILLLFVFLWPEGRR